MNVAVKKQLSMDELNSQAVFQLPAREMLSLVTVVITDLLNNNTVNVNVQNNQVAVQVCAAVSAISTLVAVPLSCTITKH